MLRGRSVRFSMVPPHADSAARTRYCSPLWPDAKRLARWSWTPRPRRRPDPSAAWPWRAKRQRCLRAAGCDRTPPGLICRFHRTSAEPRLRGCRRCWGTAFRLFLRGAIHKPEGFAADEATGYVKGARARAFAEALVDLGIAMPMADGRYRLARTATSFGPTLGLLPRTSSG